MPHLFISTKKKQAKKRLRTTSQISRIYISHFVHNKGGGSNNETLNFSEKNRYLLAETRTIIKIKNLFQQPAIWSYNNLDFIASTSQPIYYSCLFSEEMAKDGEKKKNKKHFK